jgi:uncharacterized membrane protein
MKHRTSIALFLTIATILIVAFSGRVQAQTTYTEYKVQLNSDNSATWTITQVSGLNGSVDTWAGFEGKVTSLVSAAADQTNRQMSVDNSTFQMSTYISATNSKSTAYTFTWQNFSVTKHGQLVAGDVFSVNGFFNLLYGDGQLQINYPSNCTLLSVSPTPDQKDLSTQTLEWLGTQFFVTENPQIVLGVPQTPKSNSVQLSPYVLLSVAAVAVVAAAFATWFLMANRRQKTKAAPASPTLTIPESEEEKVLRILRFNGDGVYQSAITEQCRFSKAKTSQLLSALEREGKVRRVKKGRDKIVSIVEETKGKK